MAKKKAQYEDNGRLYTCRNQIIGLQELEKLKRLRKRLTTTDGTTRAVGKDQSITSHRLMQILHENQKSKESILSSDENDFAFQFNPVEIQEDSSQSKV